MANFAISTHPQDNPTDAESMTTWVVAAYASMAEEVINAVGVGDAVIVTGTLAASAPFTSADGITRTRIECRAQSIAPAVGAPVAPAEIVVRGTVATVPALFTDGPEPLVELDIRTSRFKRGDTARETDITFWPVAAVGDMALAMADWRVGDEVVVVGQARALHDPPPDTPQVEIWARTAGVDLYPQEAHPAAKITRPGRSPRRGGTR